jgi:hypothetical protein
MLAYYTKRKGPPQRASWGKEEPQNDHHTQSEMISLYAADLFRGQYAINKIIISTQNAVEKPAPIRNP